MSVITNPGACRREVPSCINNKKTYKRLLAKKDTGPIYIYMCVCVFICYALTVIFVTILLAFR